LPGDKELLLLLNQHPEKGLAKMMDSYLALVYTIVYGKLSGICNKQDIEECVSDVFFEIYRTRSRIDVEKGALKSYLAVVAKRKAIDVFRKQRPNAGDIALDAFAHDWVASDADVEKAVVAGETADLLIQGIKALGEPDSEIMIRKYYFGQSTKIIAKALAIKENTVDKKVSRALQKLNQALGGVL